MVCVIIIVSWRVQMVHDRVIDTALLFPHAAGDGYKYGLKALAERYLDYHIQANVSCVPQIAC